MDTWTSSTLSSDKDVARGTTTNATPRATKGRPIDEPLGEGGYPAALHDEFALRQSGNGVTNESNGGGSSACANGEDFKSQLRVQIAVAQHGNRGLETALNLLCERVLDVEEVSNQRLHDKFCFEVVDRHNEY